MTAVWTTFAVIFASTPAGARGWRMFRSVVAGTGPAFPSKPNISHFFAGFCRETWKRDSVAGFRTGIAESVTVTADRRTPLLLDKAVENQSRALMLTGFLVIDHLAIPTEKSEIKSRLWNKMPLAGFAFLSSNGNEAHMTASDTLYAYEAGLITKAEAAEQALVDRLDDLYQQVGTPRPHVKSAARHVGAERSMA